MPVAVGDLLAEGTIRMESSRCRFIPGENDQCPGRISDCRFCSGREEECCASGGTVFSVFFPKSTQSGDSK